VTAGLEETAMNTMARMDTWQEMRRLQREMEQLFGDLTPAWRWPLTGEYPPVNLAREESGLTLEALCPGVESDAFEVTVVGDAVTIRGERKASPDVPADRAHRRERPLGAFARTVSVGERLDPDRTEASYTHGILRLRLTRAPEAEPKKIAIKK
jgi:HSP20 family protein